MHIWAFLIDTGVHVQVPVSSPSLTVKQLLSTFPLDKTATWHFRFRVKDDRYGYAWQDARDLNAAVPVANGVIYAKVRRPNAHGLCRDSRTAARA